MIDPLFAASAKTPVWFINLCHGLLIAFLVLCLPTFEILWLLLEFVWFLCRLAVKGVTGLVQLARRR